MTILNLPERDFLVPAIREPEWRKEALCRQAGVDMEQFFPTGRPSNKSKALCAECPVRDLCEQSALDSPWEPYGIFGGKTASELMPEWKRRHGRAS